MLQGNRPALIYIVEIDTKRDAKQILVNGYLTRNDHDNSKTFLLNQEKEKILIQKRRRRENTLEINNDFKKFFMDNQKSDYLF